MLIDPCDFDLLYTLLSIKWSKLNDDDIPGRYYQDSLASVFDLNTKLYLHLCREQATGCALQISLTETMNEGRAGRFARNSHF